MDEITPRKGTEDSSLIWSTHIKKNASTPRKGTQTTAPLYCTVLCGEAGRLFFL